MMDPMVRHPEDPGPLIPGTLYRFRWPQDDSDTEVIRQGVQEGGPGLFVLEAPGHAGGTRIRVLAEAYYPDGIRETYYPNLDPFRKADMAMGRLVVVNTLKLRETFELGTGHGSIHGYLELTPTMVAEVRRNNRAARSELKRQSSATYRAQELENMHREHDEKVLDDFAEQHAQMDLEALKYAVRPEHGGAIWRHNVRR